MKLNNVNSVNFGKSLIATCNIKDGKRQKHSASLYEYTPRDIRDNREISESYSNGKVNEQFYRSFLNNNYSRYFVLKDDKEGEIITASEVSSHYSHNNPVAEHYLEIDNFTSDKKFKNAKTPMLAFIAKIAQTNKMDSIVALDGNVVGSDIVDSGFSKVKEDVWMMTSDKFKNVMRMAKRSNGINYLG